MFNAQVQGSSNGVWNLKALLKLIRVTLSDWLKSFLCNSGKAPVFRVAGYFCGVFTYLFV